MATLSPSTLVNAISDAIEEILQVGPPGNPPLDDHYMSLRSTTMGVERTGIGRDFKVVHAIRSGISSPFRWTSKVLGADPMDSLNQGIHVPTDKYTAYPGLAKASWQGIISREVQLARGQGTIFLPVEYAKASALNAALYSEVAENVKAHAAGIMLGEIHSYYRQKLTNNFTVATVGSGFVAGTDITNANATDDKVTFVVGRGSVRNFYPGQMIDFISDADPPVKKNANPVIVESVRYVPDTSSDTGGYGQVIGISTTGEDLNAATPIAAGDMVVDHDSFTVGMSAAASSLDGPLGPESWLLTTGSAFNINVETFQQYQSVSLAVNGPFTTPVGMKAWGRFFKAYGPVDMPDTFVTSQGVTNAAVENLEGLSRFPRMGEPFTFSEGYEFGQVPFQFGSHRVKWQVSAYMPSTSDVTAANPQGGRGWGLKTRDGNIKRYVPPRSEFATEGPSDVPQEVDFLISGGPMGVFLPWPDGSGSVLPVYGAPYDHWMAVAPSVMQGILLTGMSELL